MGLWNAIKSFFGVSSDNEQQNKVQQGSPPLSPHDESLPQNQDKETEKRAMDETQQHHEDPNREVTPPTIVPPMDGSSPTASPPTAKSSPSSSELPESLRSQPPKFPSTSSTSTPQPDEEKDKSEDGEEPPKPKSGMSGAI